MKEKKIRKKNFNKFYIIFHFLSLCLFISIQNIGWSIPLIMACSPPIIKRKAKRKVMKGV